MSEVTEKIKDMSDLIAKMIDPLARAVEEIEKSNRSRLLVLLSLLLIAGTVLVAQFYVVAKMARVVSRLDSVVAQQTADRFDRNLTKLQLKRLTELALSGARDENLGELRKISQIMEEPSLADIELAANELTTPSMVVTRALNLMSGSSKRKKKVLADPLPIENVDESSSDSASE